MSILNMLNLDGKVALVTGASRGFGRAFACALAQAGANIIVTSRHPEELDETVSEITNLNRQGIGLGCDISNELQVKQLTDIIEKTFGRCDILINNAAAMRINKSPNITTLTEWQLVNHTNIDGTFNVCREIASRLMIPVKSGKIINICSTASFVVLKHFHGGAYEVSKAAIVQMTKVLAIEWAKYNITVNAIAPGYYNTQPNIDFFNKNPGLQEKVLNEIPLRRFGNINELSGLIVCLASDICNFMTGTTIIIDGGYTSW